jgi:motility quorum-sensing regulator / GCU-specific mRNA interferase toxin
MVYLMAEKRTPRYSLKTIKALFSETSSLIATKTAIQGAAERGYGSEEIVAIIQTMEENHFYKSMTANHNNAVWQDVYHVPHADGPLYLKFTDNGGSDLVLLSFKEK